MKNESTRSSVLSWHKGSIRRRLMIWGLALLGAALVLNTIAGSIYTRKQIRRATAGLQVEMVSLTARRMQSFINRKVERLQDIGIAMTLYPLGGEEQRLLGLLLLKNDRSFTELSILDSHGKEVIKFSERRLYVAGDLKKHTDAKHFTVPLSGENYIGSVYTSDRAEPYITLAVPLKTAPNRVAGVLVAETNLKFLWEVIGESKFGYAGYAYVVDDSGKLIAHQDPSRVLKNVNLKSLPKVRQFLDRRTKDDHPGEEGRGINGNLVLSTYEPVPGLGWGVILEEPVELALADLKTMERFAFLLLGVGLLVGATIIIWVSRKITKPISELRQGVEIIRSGKLDHRAQIKTGDEIEELAEEFNKMADALQTSYSTLEQRVEQRTQELAALYDVTTTVNQSLDLDSVLHAVIKKITQIFKFDTTRIFLFDEQMTELRLRASFEVHPELWAQVRKFGRGQGIIGRVADSGEPLVFGNIQNDPRYRQFSQSKATQKAKCAFFAAFPVKTTSRTFGTIIFNGVSPRTLSGDEIRLLTSMSEQLGVALEKGSLFEEVNTRSQHLSVLNTIGAAVSRSLELEVVLKEAVEKVSDALRFDSSWIYLVENSSTELHLRAHKGLPEEAMAFMASRPINAGVTGKVIETGERLVFEDVRSDRYLELARNRRMTSLGFSTLGSFPIRSKEKILGVLHVASRANHQFVPEELQLIESIAQAIGVATENATLFEEVREKTSELAAMNRELQEASRAKSEFMAAMSHELRTPLNVIIGNADLTRDGFFGDLNHDQQRALQKIARYARMLLKLINDVLMLSRIEAKRMSLELSTVAVAEIIAHAQTHVEEINRDNHLEVRWDVEPNVPPLVTDAVKLEEILQNLIGNAFKFTPEGWVAVRVRNLGESKRVEFSVADTGIGIEPASLAKIFDEFEQLNEAHTGNFNGVGLGLSIVKKYLDLMQGDIRVESQPGQGSTFTFSLPRSISEAT